MPRILGVDVPNQRRIEIGLTYIFGIGLTSSKKILAELKIDPNRRGKDLTDEEVGKLIGYIDKNIAVEGALRRQIGDNIKRLMSIGCYRGLRHRRGLPVRGQRCRTNARTRKGPKKTVARKKSVKEL
jgi:small subunit ribosomal protein S13